MSGRRSQGVLAALVAGIALVAAACSSGDALDPLPVPDTSATVPTSTTVAADYRGVVLAPVAGTTTTNVVVGPGPGILAGRVEGPEGPVAGATVRLERLVDDAVATLDVATEADGRWRANNVLGGRYRVRAWLQPDLATVEPQILFVAAAGSAEVVVPVQRFGQIVVDAAFAPDPPVVGERTNVGVRLSSRNVDAGGVVRALSLPGVPVGLDTGTAWALETSAVVTSDAAGNATFTLTCQAPGAAPLTVVLSPTQVVPLAPPACTSPTPQSPSPVEGSTTSTTTES
ncbi:MAG: carboxypeptidase-like regulatory domain-containing protein [Acidimicrobiales bacterium]